MTDDSDDDDDADDADDHHHSTLNLLYLHSLTTTVKSQRPSQKLCFVVG